MREWDGRCEKKDIDAHSAGYVCVGEEEERLGAVSLIQQPSSHSAGSGRAGTDAREKDEGEGKSGRDVSLRCGLEGMDTSLVRIYSLDGQMFTWPTDG
jgi:hypothetical protein